MCTLALALFCKAPWWTCELCMHNPPNLMFSPTWAAKRIASLFLVACVATIGSGCVNTAECDPGSTCVWASTVGHGECVEPHTPRCVAPAVWNGAQCVCVQAENGEEVPCNVCPLGRYGPLCAMQVPDSTPSQVPVRVATCDTEPEQECAPGTWGAREASGCYPQDLSVWVATVPVPAAGVATVLAETQTWRPVVSKLIIGVVCVVLGGGLIVGGLIGLLKEVS